jgi:hypothetical protein
MKVYLAAERTTGLYPDRVSGGVDVALTTTRQGGRPQFVLTSNDISYTFDAEALVRAVRAGWEMERPAAEL